MEFMMEQTNRRGFLRVAGLSATTGLFSASVSPLAEAAPEPQGQPRPGTRSMGAQLRQLVQDPEPVVMVGYYDMLSARLAAVNGFKCLFHGGAIESEFNLVPDHTGMMSMTELLELHERTVEFIPIPVMADVDDLGGDPLNVYKYTKLFERAGLGGLYFVDAPTASEARYRHDLLSKEQMVQNIHAAVDARSDIVLCVDCYAHQTRASNPGEADEALKRAIERGVAYAEAGADVLYTDAMINFDLSKRFAEAVKKPLLTGGMGSRPGGIPTSRMKEAGIKFGVFADWPDIMLSAAQKALTELKKTGDLVETRKQLASSGWSREDREKLARSEEFRQLAKKYGVIR